MKKRATDSTVLKAIEGRGGLLSSALCLRTLFTCTIVALALGGAATSAHAISGESEDFEGIFSPSCLDLRTETGLTGGDEIFACDADGEQCHLVSGTTDEGVALGFCEDEVETVIPVRASDIHPEVSIKGTAFGTVIGVVNDPGGTPIPGDIFCETSGTPSPGTKVCVHIFEDPSCTSTASCGPHGVPPPGSLDVRSDDCETVKALLAASVTRDPDQNLRWWLFSDSEATGEPASEVLSVCHGFDWEFLPLNGATIAPGLAVKYQVNREVIQTPHYTTIAGRRICKTVLGESPTHSCP